MQQFITTQSLQSPNRKQSPMASAMSSSTPHRPNASDDISVSSQSQADDGLGFSRHVSSASGTSWRGEWESIHVDVNVGPKSPPADGPHGIDLASPSSTSFSTSKPISPNPNPNPNPRTATWHQSPVSATSVTFQRPKPTPMQFQDNANYPSYNSPASYQSTFSPRSQFQSGRTDSRSRLISTHPSAAEWTRTSQRTPPYSSVLPVQRKWWHWRPAWIMYFFFLLGVCCALGHHLFYSVLNGRPAENQITMLRYGTLLAFAAKSSLVAAVITAYRQRIWTTVRTKLLSVAALDSLFAACDDVMALANWEVYKSAKIAMMLAVFVWLTPGVIILTSNTLTVKLAYIEDKGQCPGIRTLNFKMEEQEEWRTETKINGLFGLSVSLWNSTQTWVDSHEGNPNWWDYYSFRTPNFESVATLGIYSDQAMQQKNASLEICGSGWNCTYTVNFTAPGYKCTDIASGVDGEMARLGNNTPPFNTSQLLPRGNNSYLVHATLGDYSRTQMNDSEIGGMPKVPPPFPKHLGAFRTEPILWVGHSVRKPEFEPPPANRTVDGWDDAFEPKIFACEHYETFYSVDFNFTGGQQFQNVTRRDYIKPVVDTTFLPDVKAAIGPGADGTWDNTTAYPESNYVLPYPLENQPHYRRVAAFHSIGGILREQINGTMDSRLINNPNQNTKAMQTALLDPRKEWFPYPNLKAKIRKLYEDIILSMLSNPQFLAVVWAANPDQKSGTLPGNDTTLYPCIRSRQIVVYNYVARDLWVVYSISLLGAIIAIAFGTAAVLDNEGVLRNTRFSSIVAATRGPALEKVAWREERGDLSPDVRSLKVGYGVVHRSSRMSGLGMVEEEEDAGRYPERALWDAGEVRYGFGLEGDVNQMRMRSEGSLFRGRGRGN